MATIRHGRASRHADRPWTCVCGRTVFGNGGKSSHKRACRKWKESRLAAMEQTLAEIDAGTWGGSSLRPALIEQYRHQYTLEAERLRKELA